MSERLPFGKELAAHHPGHFEDPQKPTIAELSSLPPLTGLQPYPHPVESADILDFGRRLTPEESAELLRRGDEFLGATPTEE